MKNEIRNKVFNYLSFAANVENVLATSLIGLAFWLFGGEGNMDAVGAEAFQYFTVDSNILVGVFCLITVFYNIKGFKTGKLSVPVWLRKAKICGTTAVSLTLAVALCFLGPIRGFASVLVGYKFFMHVLSPTLAILALVWFENDGEYKFREVFWGLIPTIVYGTMYFIMVVLIGEEKGGWVDHYMFNQNGLWFVAIIAVLSATIGFGTLLWLLRKKAWDKIKKA